MVLGLTTLILSASFRLHASPLFFSFIFFHSVCPLLSPLTWLVDEVATTRVNSTENLEFVLSSLPPPLRSVCAHNVW